MQAQFFIQFVQTFQQVFLQNLQASFPVFTKYAASLFYGVATIELVIIGLLLALSSGNSAYTLLTRLIKISIFFFLVFHFQDLFKLVSNSVQYISEKTITTAGNTVDTGNQFTLSSLWDFNNPSNYITKGLTQSVSESAAQVPSGQAYQSIDMSHEQMQGEHMNGADNNSQDQEVDDQQGPSMFAMGKLITIAMTGILAVINLALFYFTALLALLLCPFGQITATSTFFQSAFSKFISAGLRLMSFTAVFILFSSFYDHIIEAAPYLGGNDSSGTMEQNNSSDMIDFFMALLGLGLCWLIPREISQRAGTFTMPSTSQSSSAATISMPPVNMPVAPPSVGIQAYTGNQQQLRSVAGSVSPAQSQAMPVSISSAPSSAPQAITSVSVSQSSPGRNNDDRQTGRDGKGKKDSLKSQTMFSKQAFSKERASRLRKNFHNAIDSNDN